MWEKAERVSLAVLLDSTVRLRVQRHGLNKYHFGNAILKKGSTTTAPQEELQFLQAPRAVLPAFTTSGRRTLSPQTRCRAWAGPFAISTRQRQTIEPMDHATRGREQRHEDRSRTPRDEWSQMEVTNGDVKIHPVRRYNPPSENSDEQVR